MCLLNTMLVASSRKLTLYDVCVYNSFEKELAAVEGGNAPTASGDASPAPRAGSDDEGAGDVDVPAPEGEVSLATHPTHVSLRTTDCYLCAFRDVEPLRRRGRRWWRRRKIEG